MAITKEWKRHERDLTELMKGSKDNFIQWPVIRRTMFHNAKSVEWEAVKNAFWRDELIEDKCGKPDPYKFNSKTSGNLIHHAYSILQMGVYRMPNSIFEFGGGYGSFCRLMYRLRFSGKYTLYDLPIFLELQKYFMGEVNPKANVKYLSKLEKSMNVDLFVSLWAISETPVELRDHILKTVKAKNYLIAFQGSFSGVDNVKYFTKFAFGKKSFTWELKKIEHLKDSYYLIGKK